MPNVTITPQQVVRTGLTASYTGSLNTGDVFLVNNNGRVALHFKKAGAGDCIVTIDTPETVDGLAVAQRTITIPASTGDKFIGPFPPGNYNQPGEAYLKFTIDEATGLTVAALQL